MRYIIPILLLVLCVQTRAQAPWKPDAELQKQLQESNYVHQILKANPEHAGLTRWYKKKVLKSRELPLAEDFTSLRHTGPGTIHLDQKITISGKGSIRLDTPASLGKKNPTNRNYATPEIIRPLNREDLREYNRFSVWVYADAPGVYLTFAGFTIYNEGEKVMPTPGRFEGQHFETVYPNKWQHIVWEIPDLYRDCVTGFSVHIMLAGAPAGASEKMSLYIDDMRIEQVEAENSRGFDLRKNAIAYSHSGYKLGARKQALVQNVKQNTFTLRNNITGQIAYQGTGTLQSAGQTASQSITKKTDKSFLLLDFSEFNTPGQYTITIDDLQSKPFSIGDDAYLSTAWHTLNFFFSERCGFDQPGIHQECHQDVFAYHPDGRSLSVSGGWHDAADLTQGTGNTAESGIALLEMASAVQGKDNIFYERLLEEARWGLNWVMRTRFGDGYRLGGLIIGIWTKNIRGDKDDMQTEARNTPTDNLKSASYCALAAPHFEKKDPVFARWCRNTAIEDFQFAIDLLDTQRTENNEVDLYALATVTAMRLYRLTQDYYYLDWASRLTRTVMACQQLERRTDWKTPLRGFFYESPKKKRILAYYHQSQEHLMSEGLSMLLTDAPTHADAPLWQAACEAYADYLRDIARMIAPYEVLPSAVYEVNNTNYSSLYHEGDQVGLPSLEEYNAQVRNGIPLSKDFYLRRFPVAYQFRGFHAVVMGKAKAAFILARLLKDPQLKDIATRQVEYILGYNPFAMSTVYGDGYDYPKVLRR